MKPPVALDEPIIKFCTVVTVLSLTESTLLPGDYWSRLKSPVSVLSRMPSNLPRAQMIRRNERVRIGPANSQLDSRLD